MTNEEIIKKKYPFYDENITQKDIEINAERTKELMDEARKDEAITFAEWIGKQELTYAIETGEWHNGFMGKTTEELYTEFKDKEK